MAHNGLLWCVHSGGGRSALAPGARTTHDGLGTLSDIPELGRHQHNAAKVSFQTFE
jgi:hypothetical protein